MGIDVKVNNENPKGAPENARLHAWVQLTNDRTGGRQFANFTINLSPGEFDPSATSYKLPANASAAFVEGYDQAAREIGFAQVGQLARNVAEAKVATSAARGNVSIPVRPTRIVPAGQPVRRMQPPVARLGAAADGSSDGGGRQAGGASPKTRTPPLPTPTNPFQSRAATALPTPGSTRPSPPKPLSRLDSPTKNAVTAALQDLPTMVNGSPAWQGNCASYSGVVAKRIAGVDMQTPLRRGQFKPVAADTIEAQLATFGPNRQGLVRVGNRGHQFNWVTNNKGQAVFVDATTGRVGTKLSDITVGLPPKLVTGDIQVNAFDLPQ
jgi:hypothetical protein